MTAPTETPKIDGKEPIFRSLHDPEMKWQQVKRQRNADGSESCVWEKWFAFSPTPNTSRCTRSTTPA